MTIQEANKKAIDVGYDSDRMDYKPLTGIFGTKVLVQHVALLDPQFWQCLEKSVLNSLSYEQLKLSKRNGGWWERECLVCHQIPEVIDSPHIHGVLGNGPRCGGQVKEVWHKHFNWDSAWHQLIDHLAEGGTIESYFAQL